MKCDVGGCQGGQITAPLLTTKSHTFPLTRSFDIILRSISERQWSGHDRFGLPAAPDRAAERGFEPQTDAHLRPGRLRCRYPDTHQSTGTTTLYGCLPAPGDLLGIRTESLPLMLVNWTESDPKRGALAKSEEGAPASSSQPDQTWIRQPSILNRKGERK
jgi:hypothetical protein